MAEVTIVLSDDDDGTVSLSASFKPAFNGNEDQTNAQRAGVRLIDDFADGGSLLEARVNDRDILGDKD